MSISPAYSSTYGVSSSLHAASNASLGTTASASSVAGKKWKNWFRKSAKTSNPSGDTLALSKDPKPETHRVMNAFHKVRVFDKLLRKLRFMEAYGLFVKGLKTGEGLINLPELLEWEKKHYSAKTISTDFENADQYMLGKLLRKLAKEEDVVLLEIAISRLKRGNLLRQEHIRAVKEVSTKKYGVLNPLESVLTQAMLHAPSVVHAASLLTRFA